MRVAVDVLGVEPDQLEQLLHLALCRRPSGTTSGWISKGSPTMSPTVMRGFSDVYGSWKTIWMSRRSRRSSRPFQAYMSPPSKHGLPAVGSSSRMSSRPSVDLPQPGLADDAERLPGVQVEVDAVDGLDVRRRSGAGRPGVIG